MPRIRTIKPKFWDDIKLSKISRDARLLFIGIWNFSDDLGVIVAEPVWIKSKVFPYDKLEPNQFEGWLEELIYKKFIIPITYHDELFFYIRTFSTHQQINKPNRTEICIDIETLTKLKEQSRINHGLITEQNVNDTVSIQGVIVKDSNSNSNSKGKGTGTENLLCPRMLKIMKKHIPSYVDDSGMDYTPLLSIGQFIFNHTNLTGNILDNTDEICMEWERICGWLKDDAFYSQKSLKTISTHIQEIVNKAKNPKKSSKDLSEYEKKLKSDRDNARNKNFD